MAQPTNKTSANEESQAGTQLIETESSSWRAMLFQGWVSVAMWMAIGLLLEGLIGFKTPAYLQDEQRRELFRLAHAHGTLLGLVLVLAAMCVERVALSLPSVARRALCVGSVLVPVGFLLGGIWHFESDPGPGIWLVPIGAVLVIFGTIALALAIRVKRDQE